nr:expressed protein [Hymenolepis microstoma]
MRCPVSNSEIALALNVIRDPTNDILDCQFYNETCLYLSVKGRSEIAFLVNIPRLTICQLNNGVTFGEVTQSPLNIIDVVMMIMAIVSNEFRKPMPGVAVQLNPELYRKWLYDFNNVGPFRSFLIS